jgi:hypothetical protein
MGPQLRYLGAVTPEDPAGMIAAAFTAVREINGHLPTDAEIRAELEAEGLVSDAAAIAEIRARMPRKTRRD